MKKKKIVVIIAAAVVLSLSFTVFALASDTQAAKGIRWFFGMDTSKLTEQQKADLDDSLNKMADLQKENAGKMADLQKETINKMVANGSMTREQGDVAIKRIDEQLKKIEENGFPKGMGFEKGIFGLQGRGRIGGEALTDAQKADLKDSFIKLADLHKDAVNMMVANGTITRDTGDEVIKKIDAMVQNYENDRCPLRKGMRFGDFAVWDIKGFDMSKLTDQQKADIKGYMVKISNLQKEIIERMISSGVMTREKADAVISRIDNAVKNFDTYGLQDGFGMHRGGLRGNKKTGTY